jgi:hypothetical protein
MTLHLPGGTLATGSGNENCALFYSLGFPGPIVFYLRCVAPVTSATGLFSDRPATVTFTSGQYIDIYTHETTWSPPPTVTVDFT